jgi:hypothetical protein
MWRRSTFCASSDCVEIADEGDRILMRDSKDPAQTFLGFDRQVFVKFVADIENGHFNHL